jgi:hypothetical protein
MLTNLADIWNLIPVSAFLVFCFIINYLQNNKIFLSIFRKNKQINNKEIYSSGQLIQGIISFCLFIFLSFLMIFQIKNGIWNNIALRSVGLIYLSSDIMAIVKGKNLLQKQTVYHHYAALGLAILVLCLDFQNSTVAQLGFVYTYTSTAAASVHFYLSLKLYYSVKKLGVFCYWNYVLTFTLNMFYQITKWPFTLHGLLYLPIALTFIWADIKLLKYLRNDTKIIQ